MLSGKRPRPPMMRTTSMTEFSFDTGPPPEEEVPQPSRYVAAVATPRAGRARRSPGDFGSVDTAEFLRTCGLCERRLGPGRDIFIYRGEIAFCSLECRQQKINLEEHKEK